MLRFVQISCVLGALSALGCDVSDGDEPEDTHSESSAAGRDGESGRGGASGRGTVAGGGTGAAGKQAMDAGAAGNRASAGKGGTVAPAAGASGQDAGADDADAAVSCEGEIVADRSRCLQDDAFCEPLGDGRYCTGPSAPQCPPNTEPIDKNAACPARTHCFELSESVRCARRLYTLEECAAAGGVALSDPGDGSLVCPGDAKALGSIEGAGWDEGGLCCPATKRCGARAGDTCASDEYCAYKAGQYCGQADAEATCQKRPSSCSGPGSAVCGCDQKTYPSACAASLAGFGVYEDEACK